MINKERIEYWTKGDGYITDFRRGTLGTGVKDTHIEGTTVNFANEEDTWADNKSIMLQHTASIDNIRDEDFWSVFPELNRIRDLEL